MKSAISELVAADDGLTLAATPGSGTVQIWDLSALKLTREIKTVHRYVGSRSLVILSGGVLVAANSLEGFMAGYSIAQGEILWRRKLANPDRLVPGASTDRFWYSSGLGAKRPAVESAESKTGRLITTTVGGLQHFEGGYGSSVTEMWKALSPYALRTHQQTMQIPRMSFGLLFAAFSPDCLFLSEAAGPVRCLDVRSGQLKWIFQPEPNSHVLKLYYNASDNFAYGVWYRYEHVQFRRLVRFQPATGKMEVICHMEGSSECFVQGRQQIVTSRGSVIELATGRSVGSLDFPTKAYHP